MKTRTLWLTARLALVLEGCETTKGVGRDIESAGEKMEDATR